MFGNWNSDTEHIFAYICICLHIFGYICIFGCICIYFDILRLRPCRRPPYMQEPTNPQSCQLWTVSIRCLKRDIMWVSLCWEWSDCYHQEECSLFDCNSVHALLHVMWEYILFKAIHLFLLKATWRHWCTVKWGSRSFFLQWSRRGWNDMCGVSSFALTFTC